MLKRLALFALLAAALPGCGDSMADGVPVALAIEDDASRVAERLVAVLDYVASDYGGAVENGSVVRFQEYEEQIAMVASARRLAGELPGFPAADLDALDAAVRAKAPAADVAALCGRVRARAIETYKISTAPAIRPSFERGAAIFRASCVECHGPEGRGDGKRAAELNPKPANLLDPERMAPVTPYRAYCDLTYGIAGTSMPSLTAPASDRWSVAFYACALRHLQALAVSGTAAAGADARPPGGGEWGIATLANATDAELDRRLADGAPDEALRRYQLARLRVIAPFNGAAGQTPLGLARAAIVAARAAALHEDRGEADRLVLDAYIRGIEEVEAPLRAQDPKLVAELEDAVARLRAAIAHGAPAAALDEGAGEVLALLDRAEQKTDATPMGELALALCGALLVVREGLEAALIIASILAVVRRVGFSPRAPRAVHAGWISALAAGAVTFVAARAFLAGLALNHEAIEAVVSLVAALVLFGTSFWLISKADARHWIAYVKERAAGSAAEGGVLGLFSVAFLAAYRETFESVLFFEAMMGGVRSRAVPLAAGAAAGALVLAAAVYALGRLQARLPIGPFFAASGALLSGLAVVLLGHGVHALETSGLLVPHPVALPRLEWLGVYPDAASAGAQALLLVAIVATTLAMRLGRRPEIPPAA
jgi:high-affinity iron transporter